VPRWELVPEGDRFRLLREDRYVITVGGSWVEVECRLRWYRDQEREARLAMVSRESLDLCRLGWNRAVLPAPIAAHCCTPPYFRVGAKISEAGGTHWCIAWRKSHSSSWQRPLSA
jgi:hypothetical protein